VVAEKVYLVSVVVSAVEPVAVQKRVPVMLFRRNFARGKITPELDVLFIQSVNVIVDPAGTTPDAFGTPLWVSNALIRYSPTARFFRFADWTARDVPSGPAVFSWNCPLVEEASLCRW
jgi:hypothetical protein